MDSLLSVQHSQATDQYDRAKAYRTPSPLENFADSVSTVVACSMFGHDNGGTCTDIACLQCDSAQAPQSALEDLNSTAELSQLSAVESQHDLICLCEEACTCIIAPYKPEEENSLTGESVLASSDEYGGQKCDKLSDIADMLVNLPKMKNPELKAECEKRNLLTTGRNTNANMVSSLTSYLKSELRTAATSSGDQIVLQYLSTLESELERLRAELDEYKKLTTAEQEMRINIQEQMNQMQSSLIKQSAELGRIEAMSKTMISVPHRSSGQTLPDGTMGRVEHRELDGHYSTDQTLTVMQEWSAASPATAVTTENDLHHPTTADTTVVTVQMPVLQTKSPAPTGETLLAQTSAKNTVNDAQQASRAHSSANKSENRMKAKQSKFRTKPCYYFNGGYGYCKWGNECHFIHKNAGRCQQYDATGYCETGNDCYLGHMDEPHCHATKHKSGSFTRVFKNRNSSWSNRTQSQHDTTAAACNNEGQSRQDTRQSAEHSYGANDHPSPKPPVIHKEDEREPGEIWEASPEVSKNCPSGSRQ